MNIGQSSPSFDVKYSNYEKIFQEKQDRSQKYYETLNKVSVVATVLGGIGGFIGFAASSRALFLTLPDGPGDICCGLNRWQQVLIYSIMSLGLVPAAWLGSGVLMVAGGGAIGYGLAHLIGRIVAHTKEIDYFSPTLTDYQFSQQNQTLKSQRDSLEGLFKAKHYSNEMVVVQKVKDFLKESKPLAVELANDHEFTKILNRLKMMASLSEKDFQQNMHAMSNTQLKDKYHTYDVSIQKLERQFTEAKAHLKKLLDRKVSIINNSSIQAAA